MELEVQKYLRSGKSLTDLETEYAIKCRKHPFFNVVCLNYDQLNSPMEFKLVQECRALILDMVTWGVKSFPFPRFFNVGEGHVAKEFNWSEFVALDKLDGSLIHMWHHDKYGWQIATRSVPDADCSYDDDPSHTFKQLVIEALADMNTGWDALVSHFTPGFCYTFELTAPENQIVVQYPDRKITLTGVRNVNTLEEMHPAVWLREHPTAPFACAKAYFGWDKEFAATQVSTLNPREAEGYVLLDSNWNRAKIKSDAYCFMSSSRDALSKSNKARLELILSEKDDDVLPILPNFVQNKITELKKQLSVFQDEVALAYTKIMHIQDQKEFALAALKYRFSGLLFTLRKSPITVSEALRNTQPKKLLELLSLTEEE